jgi:hypothetical protein
MLGAAVSPGSPAQFAEQIKADNAKWGAVIRKNNISVD